MPCKFGSNHQDPDGDPDDPEKDAREHVGEPVCAEVDARERDGEDHRRGDREDRGPDERVVRFPAEHERQGAEEHGGHRRVPARKAVTRLRRERSPQVGTAAAETALQERAPQPADEHQSAEERGGGSAMNEDERTGYDDRGGNQKDMASQKRDRVDDPVSPGRVELPDRECHPAVQIEERVPQAAPRRRGAHPARFSSIVLRRIASRGACPPTSLLKYAYTSRPSSSRAPIHLAQSESRSSEYRPP